MGEPRTRPVVARIAVAVAAQVDGFVFPVSASKRPAIKGGGGFRDASNDVETIEMLWAVAGGRAYIGVDCGRSRLVVVDVDRPDEISGELGLQLARYPTLTFRSLYRGEPHYWYRGAVRSRPIPGGDLKSIGGYVVASLDRDMVQLPIADWSAELDAAAIRKSSRKRGSEASPASGSASGWDFRSTPFGVDRLEALAVEVALTAPGERNTGLHRAAVAAGHLIVEGNITPESAIDLLTMAASRTGLGEAEIERTIVNGLRGAVVRRRDRLTELIERLADA